MSPPGAVLQYSAQPEGVLRPHHQVTVRLDQELRTAQGAAVYQPSGNGLGVLLGTVVLVLVVLTVVDVLAAVVVVAVAVVVVVAVVVGVLVVEPGVVLVDVDDVEPAPAGEPPQ